MKSILLVLCFLLFPRLVAAESYTVTDLGLLYPTAINNAGQIVGGDILWDHGKLTHLGTLVRTTAAAALNNRGQIVGTSGSGMISAMTERNVHAFLWQSGKLTGLGSSNTVSQYYATGINDGGQIIGTSYRHPLLWENGRKTYLPKLFKDPPYTQIFCGTGGINSRGQSVGYCGTRGGDIHAVLWQSGNIFDLGGAGGHDAKAAAINNQGQAVGYAAMLNSVRHAYLWQEGKCLDLRMLPDDIDSEANAINNRAQVVGDSHNIGEGPIRHAYLSRAFLWQGGKMLSLTALLPPHSAWHLDSARGINDLGQIIGYGTYKGKPHGFLLTPK